MSRLDILKNSLIKKENDFDNSLQNHFNTVKQANGQPLNDKRNGQTTLNKWEKQNNSLINKQEGIEKTKQAIEKEENKINDVEEMNLLLPGVIKDLVNNGVLTQWRKYPNTFFVDGVEKARIVYVVKTKSLAYRYLKQVPNKEQHKKFAQVYNKINKILTKEVKNDG